MDPIRVPGRFFRYGARYYQKCFRGSGILLLVSTSTSLRGMAASKISSNRLASHHLGARVAFASAERDR